MAPTGSSHINMSKCVCVCVCLGPASSSAITSPFCPSSRAPPPPFVPLKTNTALAALCGVGGVVGYAKKRSVPSLVAGVAFAAAYGYAANTINVGDPAQGHALAAGTSALLAAAMGARLAKTGKFMPAGVLTAVGLAGGAYNFLKYREWS
jgi:uncharacterized membrane protein (UPF0136 family)